MPLRAGSIALLLGLLACSGESAEPGAEGGGSGGVAARGGSGGAGAGGAATGGTNAGGSAGIGGTGATGGSPPLVPESLPLGAITVTCDDEIEDDVKILCRFRLVYADGTVGYDDHAGIELRGRSSQAFPKKNYSLELRTAADVEASANFFGMGAESDWILDGSWADRSLFRNDLVFDLFRSFGADHYAPECQHCTLTRDGEAQGIYRLCEKIKRDDDRLALQLDDGSGNSFVIKQDDEGPLRLDLGLQRRWRVVSPSETTVTEQQISGMQDWLDALDSAMQSDNRNDPAAGMTAVLDPTSAVDFVLLQEFSKNVDAYNLSLHFAKDLGGRGRFVPWDFDLSFGQPTLDTPGARNEAPDGWIRNRTRLIEALTGTTAIASALAPRWRELRAGPLSDEAVDAWIDSYLETLTPQALAENFAIWPIEEVDFGIAYEPYSQYPVSSHQDEVQKLRAWIQARLAWLDANIDSYPD